MQDADEEEEEEGEDPAVKLVLEIPVWATIAEIQAVKLPVSSAPFLYLRDWYGAVWQAREAGVRLARPPSSKAIRPPLALWRCTGALHDS